MEWSFVFFFNSVCLGVGLAMDAFSVSLANGLSEPNMKKGKMSCIAGVFAFFQALMPMIGWICVHSLVNYFNSFQRYIPWIALALLVFIGGKMLIESIKNKNSEEEYAAVTPAALLLQGIATSIDALSVGFTISDYEFSMAAVCSLVIAVITFIICMFGLLMGKRFGTKFSGKAGFLGGIVLIAVGIEIFIKGVI